MAEFVAHWNFVAAIWSDRILAVLWQSTLLTVAVALLLALTLRSSSPALRYCVWTIVAVKLLVMPFWTFAAPLPSMPFSSPAQIAGVPAFGLPDPPAVSPTEFSAIPDGVSRADDAAPAVGPGVAPPPSLLRRVTWQSWLLLGWGAIVLAQCARIIWQHRGLNRLLLMTRPADDSLAAIVRETALRLGLQQSPQTVLTDLDCSPFVCGVRRPTLVLPGNLVSSLSSAELTQVLLHELAHIRRLDLVWGWIGEVVRVVYFFHPVAHWISYRLRLERELACDNVAMVVSGQGAAEYAATLVNVISHSSVPSVFKTSAASAGLDGGPR